MFDPQSLPFSWLSEQGAVPVSALDPVCLRERFAHPPAWSPEPHTFLIEAARAASVLVPLVCRPEGFSVLLTQRTAHLHDHAGQISFPGGRAEAHDVDAIDTALRETEEEIGLNRAAIEVLGQLPEYATGTGYRVTPVVGLITELPPLALDAFEVAEVFEVPLNFLMDARNHQRRIYRLPQGSERIFYAMPYRDVSSERFIWGATAGMLRNLFHFLRA